MAGMRRSSPTGRSSTCRIHQIFHIIYDLDDRYQVPGMGAWYRGVTYEQDGYTRAWRGIYDDKGRLMVAICHNMDLGDSWEHADDPDYPQKFSALGIRIGVNYVAYCHDPLMTRAALICSGSSASPWARCTPSSGRSGNIPPWSTTISRCRPTGTKRSEWVFARLMYPWNGWGFPLRQRLDQGHLELDHRLSPLRPPLRAGRPPPHPHPRRSVEQPVNLDDGDQYDWPWLYGVEVGHWALTDAQVRAFREYLLRGGFFMCDDFHGTQEWESSSRA